MKSRRRTPGFRQPSSSGTKHMSLSCLQRLRARKGNGAKKSKQTQTHTKSTSASSLHCLGVLRALLCATPSTLPRFLDNILYSFLQRQQQKNCDQIPAFVDFVVALDWAKSHINMEIDARWHMYIVLVMSICFNCKAPGHTLIPRRDIRAVSHSLRSALELSSNTGTLLLFHSQGVSKVDVPVGYPSDVVRLVNQQIIGGSEFFDAIFINGMDVASLWGHNPWPLRILEAGYVMVIITEGVHMCKKLKTGFREVGRCLKEIRRQIECKGIPAIETRNREDCREYWTATLRLRSGKVKNEDHKIIHTPHFMFALNLAEMLYTRADPYMEFIQNPNAHTFATQVRGSLKRIMDTVETWKTPPFTCVLDSLCFSKMCKGSDIADGMERFAKWIQITHDDTKPVIRHIFQTLCPQMEIRVWPVSI